MREKSAGGVFPFSRARSRSGLDAPAYNPLKLSQLQNPVDWSIAASETQSYSELGAASSLARLPPPLSSCAPGKLSLQLLHMHT